MFNSEISYTLFVAIAVLGSVVSFFVMSAAKQLKKQARETDIRLNAITFELGKLLNAFVEPLNQLHEIEQRSRRLTERFEQLEFREKGQRHYDQAVKMVQKGSSVDEIISQCGLNRGEAELINVMHGGETKQKIFDAAGSGI